jgi:hypothetical protein
MAIDDAPCACGIFGNKVECVVHDVCTWCVNGASTCEGWFDEAIVLCICTKNFSKTIMYCAIAVCFVVVHGSLT